MPTPSAPRPSRTRHAVTALAAAALAWAAAGCAEKTDLGRECELSRRATAAERDAGLGDIVPILESEISEGQDFISFGVTACDDLVCLRDKDFPKAGGAGAVAKGYCSRSCVMGNACEVTDSRALPNVGTGMSCRPLVLDEQTLAAIKAADPDFYAANFGNVESASFCASNTAGPAADGGVPDAGTP